MFILPPSFFFFFFNDTATTEIYTLSLHDALPILDVGGAAAWVIDRLAIDGDAHHIQLVRALRTNLLGQTRNIHALVVRSEEHTSELQSLAYLVCRLLLEKKKKRILL